MFDVDCRSFLELLYFVSDCLLFTPRAIMLSMDISLILSRVVTKFITHPLPLPLLSPQIREPVMLDASKRMRCFDLHRACAHFLLLIRFSLLRGMFPVYSFLVNLVPPIPASCENRSFSPHCTIAPRVVDIAHGYSIPTQDQSPVDWVSGSTDATESGQPSVSHLHIL